MAQLLVYLKNQTHPNQNISDSLAKQGDIIYVADDNHVWGTHEDKREWVKKYGTQEGWPGDYVIIKVNGVTVEKAKALMAVSYRVATVDDPEYNAPDEADRKVLVVKRAWNLTLGKIASEKLNAIIKAGFGEFNFSDIDFELRHKLTNTKFNG